MASVSGSRGWLLDKEQWEKENEMLEKAFLEAGCYIGRPETIEPFVRSGITQFGVDPLLLLVARLESMMLTGTFNEAGDAVLLLEQVPRLAKSFRHCRLYIRLVVDYKTKAVLYEFFVNEQCGSDAEKYAALDKYFDPALYDHGDVENLCEPEDTETSEEALEEWNFSLHQFARSRLETIIRDASYRQSFLEQNFNDPQYIEEVRQSLEIHTHELISEIKKFVPIPRLLQASTDVGGYAGETASTSHDIIVPDIVPLKDFTIDVDKIELDTGPKETRRKASYFDSVTSNTSVVSESDVDQYSSSSNDSTYKPSRDSHFLIKYCAPAPERRNTRIRARIVISDDDSPPSSPAKAVLSRRRDQKSTRSSAQSLAGRRAHTKSITEDHTKSVTEGHTKSVVAEGRLHTRALARGRERLCSSESSADSSGSSGSDSKESMLSELLGHGAYSPHLDTDPNTPKVKLHMDGSPSSTSSSKVDDDQLQTSEEELCQSPLPPRVQKRRPSRLVMNYSSDGSCDYPSPRGKERASTSPYETGHQFSQDDETSSQSSDSDLTYSPGPRTLGPYSAISTLESSPIRLRYRPKVKLRACTISSDSSDYQVEDSQSEQENEEVSGKFRSVRFTEPAADRQWSASRGESDSDSDGVAVPGSGLDLFSNTPGSRGNGYLSDTDQQLMDIASQSSPFIEIGSGISDKVGSHTDKFHSRTPDCFDSIITHQKLLHERPNKLKASKSIKEIYTAIRKPMPKSAREHLRRHLKEPTYTDGGTSSTECDTSSPPRTKQELGHAITLLSVEVPRVKPVAKSKSGRKQLSTRKLLDSTETADDNSTEYDSAASSNIVPSKKKNVGMSASALVAVDVARVETESLGKDIVLKPGPLSYKLKQQEQMAGRSKFVARVETESLGKDIVLKPGPRSYKLKQQEQMAGRLKLEKPDPLRKPHEKHQGAVSLRRSPRSTDTASGEGELVDIETVSESSKAKMRTTFRLENLRRSPRSSTSIQTLISVRDSMFPQPNWHRTILKESTNTEALTNNDCHSKDNETQVVIQPAQGKSDKQKGQSAPERLMSGKSSKRQFHSSVRRSPRSIQSFVRDAMSSQPSNRQPRTILKESTTTTTTTQADMHQPLANRDNETQVQGRPAGRRVHFAASPDPDSGKTSPLQGRNYGQKMQSSPEKLLSIPLVRQRQFELSPDLASLEENIQYEDDESEMSEDLPVKAKHSLISPQPHGGKVMNSPSSTRRSERIFVNHSVVKPDYKPYGLKRRRTPWQTNNSTLLPFKRDNEAQAINYRASSDHSDAESQESSVISLQGELPSSQISWSDYEAEISSQDEAIGDSATSSDLETCGVQTRSDDSEQSQKTVGKCSIANSGKLISSASKPAQKCMLPGLRSGTDKQAKQTTYSLRKSRKTQTSDTQPSSHQSPRSIPAKDILKIINLTNKSSSSPSDPRSGTTPKQTCKPTKASLSSGRHSGATQPMDHISHPELSDRSYTSARTSGIPIREKHQQHSTCSLPLQQPLSIPNSNTSAAITSSNSQPFTRRKRKQEQSPKLGDEQEQSQSKRPRRISNPKKGITKTIKSTKQHAKATQDQRKKQKKRADKTDCQKPQQCPESFCVEGTQLLSIQQFESIIQSVDNVQVASDQVVSESQSAVLNDNEKDFASSLGNPSFSVVGVHETKHSNTTPSHANAEYEKMASLLLAVFTKSSSATEHGPLAVPPSESLHGCSNTEQQEGTNSVVGPANSVAYAMESNACVGSAMGPSHSSAPHSSDNVGTEKQQESDVTTVSSIGVLSSQSDTSPPSGIGVLSSRSDTNAPSGIGVLSSQSDTNAPSGIGVLSSQIDTNAPSGIGVLSSQSDTNAPSGIGVLSSQIDTNAPQVYMYVPSSESTTKQHCDDDDDVIILESFEYRPSRKRPRELTPDKDGSKKRCLVKDLPIPVKKERSDEGDFPQSDVVEFQDISPQEAMMVGDGTMTTQFKNVEQVISSLQESSLPTDQSSVTLVNSIPALAPTVQDLVHTAKSIGSRKALTHNLESSCDTHSDIEECSEIPPQGSTSLQTTAESLEVGTLPSVEKSIPTQDRLNLSGSDLDTTPPMTSETESDAQTNECKLSERLVEPAARQSETDYANHTTPSQSESSAKRSSSSAPGTMSEHTSYQGKDLELKSNLPVSTAQLSPTLSVQSESDTRNGARGHEESQITVSSVTTANTSRQQETDSSAQSAMDQSPGDMANTSSSARWSGTTPKQTCKATRSSLSSGRHSGATQPMHALDHISHPELSDRSYTSAKTGGIPIREKHQQHSTCSLPLQQPLSISNTEVGTLPSVKWSVPTQDRPDLSASDQDTTAPVINETELVGSSMPQKSATSSLHLPLTETGRDTSRLQNDSSSIDPIPGSLLESSSVIFPFFQDNAPSSVLFMPPPCDTSETDQRQTPLLNHSGRSKPRKTIHDSLLQPTSTEIGTGASARWLQIRGGMSTFKMPSCYTGANDLNLTDLNLTVAQRAQSALEDLMATTSRGFKNYKQKLQRIIDNNRNDLAESVKLEHLLEKLSKAYGRNPNENLTLQDPCGSVKKERSDEGDFPQSDVVEFQDISPQEAMMVGDENMTTQFRNVEQVISSLQESSLPTDQSSVTLVNSIPALAPTVQDLVHTAKSIGSPETLSLPFLDVDDTQSSFKLLFIPSLSLQDIPEKKASKQRIKAKRSTKRLKHCSSKNAIKQPSCNSIATSSQNLDVVQRAQEALKDLKARKRQISKTELRYYSNRLQTIIEVNQNEEADARNLESVLAKLEMCRTDQQERVQYLTSETGSDESDFWLNFNMCGPQLPPSVEDPHLIRNPDSSSHSAGDTRPKYYLRMRNTPASVKIELPEESSATLNRDFQIGDTLSASNASDANKDTNSDLLLSKVKIEPVELFPLANSVRSTSQSIESSTAQSSTAQCIAGVNQSSTMPLRVKTEPVEDPQSISRESFIPPPIKRIKTEPGSENTSSSAFSGSGNPHCSTSSVATANSSSAETNIAQSNEDVFRSLLHPAIKANPPPDIKPSSELLERLLNLRKTSEASAPSREWSSSSLSMTQTHKSCEQPQQFSLYDEEREFTQCNSQSQYHDFAAVEKISRENETQNPVTSRDVMELDSLHSHSDPSRFSSCFPVTSNSNVEGVFHTHDDMECDPTSSDFSP